MEKFFKIKSSINKSLFVSGITRSGKIVLCKILSSFKGVQNIKLSYELELILSLYKSKKIKFFPTAPYRSPLDRNGKNGSTQPKGQ